MRNLVVIVIAFVLLGSVYAVATPVFEASDELWHYPFVRHLADGNPLPVQEPANVGPWKQEASQQPLYYALAAALTWWIDTSDMERVRWLNPHADNGILTHDGNTNLVIHPEDAPWRGTVLAVRLIRLVSVLMGAGTVLLTWHIGRRVFPDRPELALAAAAVNAFTPMFLFISGAVNNDNLAVLLCSAALYLMLRNSAPLSSAKAAPAGFRENLVLGLVLGLGALTKTTALGLIPLALIALVVSIWRQAAADGWQSRLKAALTNGLAIVVPPVLIAGWWYIRNYRLYGDWLGWNAFAQVLGTRAHPANLRQLWGERWGFSLSYWGLFGGVNVPMSTWVYHALNAIAVVGLAGLVVFLAQQAWTSGRQASKTVGGIASLGRLPPVVHRLWPPVLLIGWTAAVLVGLVRWATTTWSSQGRLVFPAISAISVLLVGGLFGWLPRRAGKWETAVLGGFMFAISALAPWVWIAPAYRPPPEPTDDEIANITHPMSVDLDNQMRLLGYDLPAGPVQPGDQLELSLFWQNLSATERNWSVFVHLNDPAIGAPIAQRDMYPGQGLLATSLLRPGQRIRNTYRISVPGTAYAPAEAELVVGLYDFASGERLRTAAGQDAIRLVTVEILPASDGGYPNPVHYDFGGQVALVGYQIQPRRLLAGETVTLTLFWRALNKMEIDYTVFTHLRDLEDPSNRIYGQDDAPPPGGTSHWQPGQVVEAAYHLTLATDTPAAVHEIEVGVYFKDTAGEFQRLQLVTPDGRLVDDFLILAKVRVD